MAGEAPGELKQLLLACVPFVTLWLGAATYAWIRHPAVRGSSLRRWRDRTAPTPDSKRDADLVDLSLHASAYWFGLRTGALVRGVAYLMLVSIAVIAPHLLLAVLAFLAAIWVFNQWQRVANLGFFAIANDDFAGFAEAAMKYLYPGHRRGVLRYLAKTGHAHLLSTVGVGFVIAASLPLLREGDALTTGIPGLQVEHTHLPSWAISAVSLAIGVALSVVAARVERSAKRRMMRRETKRSRWRLVETQMVFLRPFGSEELRVPAHPGPRREGISFLTPRHTEFLEDVLTWMLWSRGEVVAIANPGAERVRTLGAAHRGVSARKSWTSEVEKLLEAANGIVLVPGTSPGVAWEFEQVRGNPDCARKSLVVNPEPAADPKPFLALVGSSGAQEAALRERRILPVAAILRPGGTPKLLCGPLAEDIDFEVAVEWFLVNELPAPQFNRRLAAVAKRLMKTAGKLRS